MADLFWPGDHRAAEVMSDAAFLAAMVDVENAWLRGLVDAGVAPRSAAAELGGVVTAADATAIADGAEAGGNPVIGLVELLRARIGGEPARWLHRGLTSQDVIDTALMLCLRTGLDTIGEQLTAQVCALIGLIENHRDAPFLARTLTQPALPTTAGMKFASWLDAVLDAAEVLAALPVLPVQAAGAAGTMAAATELTGSPAAAVGLTDALAAALRLAPATPWHTSRATVTRAGDALVTCCDAWGHLAADIATGSRAEIGEFTEGRGGGSSTMPHKSNPVLSVLLRRTALTAPALGATLHAASAASVDERSDGGWHAEWATLRTLARHTVIAASQATDLLATLRIHEDRAAANLGAAEGLLAEQQKMSELTGRARGSSYLGAADLIVDRVLHRGRHHVKELL
jgi:3-carboxy-cis,cis-muconate cycloisomerase